MNPILRIILGLAVVAGGVGIVVKADLFRSWLGDIPWAEQHIGTGGSRLFYKLVGAGVCIIGIFIATNIISDILTSFASIFAHRITG